MKSFIKIISSIFIFVFILSISISASFIDVDTINTKCVDEVKLLTAIGIIKGYEDGSFRPEGAITRAEACKMIYVLRNGGEDDNAENWKMATSFADVPTNVWYAGYVAYCAQYGIVNGRNATTFDPNANITSTELAKMLLCVAGYRSDIQGYIGSNWASNVRIDGEAAGLFTGYSAALSLAAPRQWAAKMFANCINNTATITYLGNTPIVGVTVGNKYLKQETIIDVILANDEWAIDGGALAQEGKCRLSTLGIEINLDADSSLVGKEVKIAYRDTTGWGANPDATTQIYGATETGTTVFGALNVTSTGSGASTKYTIKVGDKAIATDVLAAAADAVFAPVTAFSADIAGAVNSIDAAQVNVTAQFNTVVLAKVALATKSTYTDIIAYDIDGDNRLDYAFINPVFFAEITDISKTAIVFGANTFALGTNSLVTCANELVKGDIVQIEASAQTKAMNISKITPTSGSYTEKTATNKYIIGNKSYNIADNAIVGITTNLIADTAVLANIFGQTLIVYADNQYILAAKSNEASSKLTTNFAYIVKQTTSAEKVTVDMILADGSKAKMQYDNKVNDSATTYYTAADVTAEAGIVGKVLEYTTTSAGLLRLRKAYTPTTGIAFPNATGYTLNCDKDTLTNGGITLLTNADSYIFVKYKDGVNDAYAVMKPEEFSADLANVTILARTDAIVYTGIQKAFIGYYETNGAIPTASVAPKTVYITSGISEKYDEKEDLTKKYISVVDIGTGIEATHAIAPVVPANITIGAFYLAVFNEQNNIAFTTGNKITGAEADWTLTSVDAIDNGVIQIAGSLKYKSDFANAKIYTKADSVITIADFKDITISVNGANNILIHDTAGIIDLVIVSTDGKLVTK